MPHGIVCPYKDKCTGYPLKCRTCKNNRGIRDYYRPDTDTDTQTEKRKTPEPPLERV